MKKDKKQPIINIAKLSKSFNVGKGTVDVLKDISLEVFPGEFVILFGPSGCGKSTLLNTMVGLEVPTKGEVIVRGKNFYEMKENDRTIFRRKKFGIVYQQPNWIRSLNVLDNIAFPLCLEGLSEKKARARAKNLLNLFRLEEFEKNIPTELSGGQQQKVSAARSLITNPWILIADEPTGNLDTTSAADLMYTFKFLNNESKRTVIMVTHNPEYEKYATKIIKMEDGRIISTKINKLVNLKEDKVLADIVPGDSNL